MIKMPSVIPWWWKLGAVLALLGALYAFDQWRVGKAEQRGFDRATSERAARDAVAVVTRVQDNAVLGAKQDGFNLTITKEKDETLKPVVQRIYVDRVRVGPGICGPSPATQTEDAGSGDSRNSATRLVSPEAERRVKELEVEVETHLATGRSCQAFGRLNGFYP